MEPEHTEVSPADKPVIYTTNTAKNFVPQTEVECAPHDNLVDWLNYGIRMGWVSNEYCGTHDPSPYTPEEEAAWEDGDEGPCMWFVRIWEDGRPLNVRGGREGW